MKKGHPQDGNGLWVLLQLDQLVVSRIGTFLFLQFSGDLLRSRIDHPHHELVVRTAWRMNPSLNPVRVAASFELSVITFELIFRLLRGLLEGSVELGHEAALTLTIAIGAAG